MADEQQLQETYVEYQQTEQQLKALKEQVELIDTKLQEAQGLFSSIEEMGQQKQGSGILVPMSNGIFLKGALADTGQLFVNVGSGVVVPKTFGEVRELIASQLAEMQAIRQTVLTDFEALLQKYAELEGKLKKLVA
ncbi:MAG: prefoldin subunit alpha [Nanoarchaeota archaeon]